MKTYSLYELNEHIRRVLALNLPEALWVSCEIAQLKASRGHYYLELIDKSEGSGVRGQESGVSGQESTLVAAPSGAGQRKGGEVIAHAEAVIWHSRYRQLRKKLGFNLDGLLRSGLAVRVKAKPDFHERFGLKLIIEDIDPSYTLGQLELQRQQTIQRLKEKGLMTLNQQLRLPSVIQRIAVISSDNAAGYQDFLDQLHRNDYGYEFSLQLFPSAMQGSQVEPVLLQQLKKINRQAINFDCLVIIRGGGSRMDLEAFDRLKLCSALAQAKLPIISGIGHEIDQSVVDMVAHSTLKTPTAAADFIINQNALFETRLFEYGMQIKQQGLTITHMAQIQTERLEQQLRFSVQNKIRFDHNQLELIQKEIPVWTRQLLQKADGKLKELEKLKTLLSPEAVLRRGFSLTLKDGKIIKSAAELSEKDEIQTRFLDGVVASIVRQSRLKSDSSAIRPVGDD